MDMEHNTSEDLRELLSGGNQTRLQEMPALPLPAALLPMVYVCLCMTYLTTTASEPFAAALLLLTVFMAALTLRSPWLIAMMAVPCTLLVSMSEMLAVAAVPIALICGTAYGAFVLLNVRVPLAAAVPVLSVAAGWLITDDGERALLALLPVPAMIVLSRTLRMGMHRIRAICQVAVALVVPALIAGLYALIRHPSAATILTDIPAAVTASRHALARALASWEVGAGENAGRVVIEGMELALAGTLFNILPGMLVALLAVFGYMANLICLTLFRTYERSRYLSRRVFVLVLSVPAAATFLLGYLMLLVIGENVGVGAQFVEAVAENLYLAFFPAMILAGMLCCIRIFLQARHRLLCLVGFILIFALSLTVGLTVLSVVGAGSVIWQTVRRRIRFSRNVE